MIYSLLLVKLSSEIKHFKRLHQIWWTQNDSLLGQLFSLCLLNLQLSKSLGTVGTCAVGQMGTDGARCIRMPQFGQRQRILLAPSQSRETWWFFCVFAHYSSSTTHRHVIVKLYQTLSYTQIQKYPNRTGGLSPLAVLLWPFSHSLGCWIQTNQTLFN